MVVDRRIRIVKGFSGYRENTLCFKTGSHVSLVYDMTKFAFEDEGPEYSPFSPTAVGLFYERLLLGDSFPNEMILNTTMSLTHAMATALYVAPDLVLSPHCASLVKSFEMNHKWGEVGKAHVCPDHASVLYATHRALENLTHDSAPDEMYQYLLAAATVISSYLQTGLVPSPVEIEVPEVIEQKGSFVVVKSPRPCWEYIYGQGFLSGVWFVSSHEGHMDRLVLFKKSSFVRDLDMLQVGKKLNRLEFDYEGVVGDGWLHQYNETLLLYPVKNPVTGDALAGTSLKPSQIIELVKGCLNDS
jgi:hypothetical protein